MMRKLINDYVYVFTNSSANFKDVVGRCIEYWMPEPAPMILLLSAIGKSFVKQINTLSENEKKKLFQHVEEGMHSSDRELSIAVATGLIESMVTASDEDDQLWKQIEEHLGIESKKHAIAWKNFGQ